MGWLMVGQRIVRQKAGGRMSGTPQSHSLAQGVGGPFLAEIGERQNALEEKAFSPSPV